MENPEKSQKSLFIRWVIFDIFLQSVFCICILYFAQSVFAIKYSLQNQFQSTISTRYCVDDDYDDSGGRTQRGILNKII